MSGHSKWANIKHRKAAQDAKKAKVFTKILKEITIAARIGGGDPEANPRLRLAIERARDNNLPKDNIDKAIKRGTGELSGVNYEEYIYEGYAPGGVALLIEVMTDNKNRTGSEVRSLLSKNGGSMAEAGAVSWIFEKKGVITLEGISEDKVMEVAIESGADDIESDGDIVNVYCSVESFEGLTKNLKEVFKDKVKNAELTMVPKNTVNIEDKDTATRVIKLVELLEDHDDVQKVHANFDIPDNIMESLA
ncbi:MAG TPA: YebC/PmpR family DNA-binding transcriptional regulator [Spirochaetota bacterium]|nr:YebC/PmpR family DNA-binding transcriptional regulator [Spirochaetota bacterium]HOM37818.1 YebC/PmpR family DNA-binding transcriptional regulator [Spirochaetota bacterium]HPQ49305.1 YebC/PmpR family DNA-binding transcriptional regulator [Spirochaetota bacterium]